MSVLTIKQRVAIIFCVKHEIITRKTFEMVRKVFDETS